MPHWCVSCSSCSRTGTCALGLLAAYLYASNGIFYDLVSFAFYYYWDIPLTFVVLGALLLAYRRPTEATRWLTLAALALGVRRVAARLLVAAVALPVAASRPSVAALRRKLLDPGHRCSP